MCVYSEGQGTITIMINLSGDTWLIINSCSCISLGLKYHNDDTWPDTRPSSSVSFVYIYFTYTDTCTFFASKWYQPNITAIINMDAGNIGSTPGPCTNSGIKRTGGGGRLALLSLEVPSIYSSGFT